MSKDGAGVMGVDIGKADKATCSECGCLEEGYIATLFAKGIFQQKKYVCNQCAAAILKDM